MSVETRRSVKSHASDAWKRRLRADVLERVRAHRAALLTRARGDGSSPGDGLRTLLNDGLREILHDAIDTETRRRMSQDPDDSDDGMWDDVIADPRTDGRAASAACARTDPPTTSGSGPKGFGHDLVGETSRDDSISPLVKSPPSSRATWNELLALGFTDVEYDSLMAEMHRGFEEEIREEEARMLALELEKTELLENEETRDACERHERWMMAGDGAGDEGTGTKRRSVVSRVPRVAFVADARLDILQMRRRAFVARRSGERGERRPRSRERSVFAYNGTRASGGFIRDARRERM
jgi:hypothetical protein